jgi:hypothetical protein
MYGNDDSSEENKDNDNDSGMIAEVLEVSITKEQKLSNAAFCAG